jgi:hypothetical protein
MISKSEFLRKILEKEEIFRPSDAAIKEQFRRYNKPLEYEEEMTEFNQADALRYLNTKDIAYTKEELPHNMSISHMSSGMSTSAKICNNPIIMNSTSAKMCNNPTTDYPFSFIEEEQLTEDEVIWDESIFVQCWVCKDKDMRVNISTNKLECKCGFYIDREEYEKLLSDNYVEIKEELSARALAFKTLGRG